MVTTGGVASWALSSALGGCVDESAPDATPDNNDSGNAAADSASDDGSSDSGGSRDCPDDGTDGSNGVSDPNQIMCGAEKCNTQSGEYCCKFLGSVGKNCAAPPRCQDAGAAIEQERACDFAERCDEAADCSEGAKCCLGSEKGYSERNCVSQCGDASIAQLCKTNEECGDAGPCNEKVCRGARVWVCGSPGGLCD